MARQRTLRPDVRDDEDLCALSVWHRQAFLFLMCEADRAGRLEDRPTRLHRRCFPYDATFPTVGADGVIVFTFGQILDDLVARRFLLRYVVAGRSYLAFKPRSWQRHQRPRRDEPESILPAPPAYTRRVRARAAVHALRPACVPIGAPTPTTGLNSEENTPVVNASTATDPSLVREESPPTSDLEIWRSGDLEVHTQRAREAGCGNPAHAWCGSRFCVPRFLHDDWHRAQPADDLVGWYAALDAEVTASDEPLAPDALAWLRARYRARQLAAVVPRTATRRMRQDPADRGAWTCAHRPGCRSTTDCIARTLADGRGDAAARGP
jgi:hypothetical protein